MKLVRKAIPLASLIACTVALCACRGDRAGQTTTRSASDEGRTTTTSDGRTIAPASTVLVVGSGPGSSADRTSLDFGGEPVMHYGAATGRIANGHCARAMFCKDIGLSKRTDTPAACSRATTEKLQDDLRGDCPNEIDITKLDACLVAVARRSCDQLDAPIQSLGACQASTLCD